MISFRDRDMQGLTGKQFHPGGWAGCAGERPKNQIMGEDKPLDEQKG